MHQIHQIKQTVQFPEYTAVPKEQSENALFDILQEDVIEESLYPFSKVRVKKDKGKRLFLNKEQIEKLRTLKIEYEGKDEIFRDMFIFFCVCRGIMF